MGLGSRIRDPGSGKKPIPDPGSRGQKGTVFHALSLPPPWIEPGSPASQHINFIGSRSKMTCKKLQNAIAKR